MSLERTEQDPMPKGIGNAYWFQVFNSMSFSIVLGLPMMLYFKSLGASVTVLGVLASLSPLLMILQIPAASYVERVGYRKFVLSGWSIRSIFIALAIAVPLLPPHIDATSRIVLMLFLLFLFNASRGFSSCGFLPWISQLVPESVRGRYVSMDQICSFSAIMTTSVIVSFILRCADGQMGFAAVFAISFMGATISLFFLKRIPDVEVSEESKNREPVPWLSMLKHEPFKRCLIFNVVFISGISGGVISVPMIRDHFGLADDKFMLLNASWGVFFLIGALLSRKTLDQVGSKPILALGLGLIVFHLLGWATISSGLLPFTFWTVCIQQMTWGFGYSLFQIANVRLIMGTVPDMGRSHFFAIYSVCNSLVAGLCPIFWGILIDAVTFWHKPWGGWEWNVYSLMYCFIAMFIAAAIVVLKSVPEPKAMSTDKFFRELLVKSPGRALGRLMVKRMGP